MSDSTDGFDPEAPEEREIGREMVDQSTGLGSVVAHLYRGEMDRTVEWCNRIDTTTNWAVTVMSAVVAYAFSGNVYLWAVAHRLRRVYLPLISAVPGAWLFHLRAFAPR